MENSSCDAACHFLLPQEACGINLFLKFLIWSVSMFQIPLPCSCKCCNCNCNWNHSFAEKLRETPVITTEKELTETRSKDQDDEMALTQEDINTVMRNIGINLDQEMNSMVSMAISNDSITRIFVDNEPSLQEVQEAFLVFDHNNDGYFDASDLQRMLNNLGLGEGLGVDECEQMIAQYDTNNDRRIDVAEFTKVLESGLLK